MSVIIHGSGRSGTNMLLEILRGSEELCSDPFIMEDKGLFRRKNLAVPDDYLTKCDIHYVPYVEKQGEFLDLNKHARILWSIRDPRDMILSKMYRGKARDGIPPADDATPDGCLEDMAYMYKCYIYLKTNYQDRVYVVKMENILFDIISEVKRISDFLNIKFNLKMLDFPSRMRNPEYKTSKYKVLDLTRAFLWRDLDHVYNSYFKTQKPVVESLFGKVDYIIKEFGYQ